MQWPKDTPRDFDLNDLEWGLGIDIFKNLSTLNIQPGLKMTHTGYSWFVYILHCISPTIALPPLTILDKILITVFEFLWLYHLKSLFWNGGMFPSMIRPSLAWWPWITNSGRGLTPCMCLGFAYTLLVKMIKMQHTNDQSEEISCMILNNFRSLKWEIANQRWESIFNYMLNRYGCL